MTLRAPIGIRLPDETSERVRRDHDTRIRELQATPAARGKWILDVELPDATDVLVAHGLGVKVAHLVSSPRSPAATGRIVDRTAAVGEAPDKYVVLQAAGFGATVTVDVWVAPR